MARAYIRGWAKARRECIERAQGLCSGCGKDIAAAGEIPEVNHILALIDGGEETAQSNLECLCPDCHKPHTRDVVRRNAKTKRILAKQDGKVSRWKRKLESKPMAKRYRPVNWRNRDKPVEQRGKMR